jgi:hypothetical protein
MTREEEPEEVPSGILLSPSAKAAGFAGVADSDVRNNAVFLLPRGQQSPRQT